LIRGAFYWLNLIPPTPLDKGGFLLVEFDPPNPP
jgi:hypothetical protein